MNDLSNFCGIVLSGGKSSRMGRDKSEILIDNRSFLEIQLEKVRSLGLPGIFVSGKASPCSYAKSIPDMIPGLGPLGGLYSSFLSCSKTYEYALVLGVDIPLIKTETLQDLILDHKNSDREATILSCKGRIEPLIAVYKTDSTRILKNLINEGSLDVKSFIKALDHGFFEFTGDPAELANFNYPRDLSGLS